MFDIRDFGAVGDGETDNTEAIQEAVNAAGEWGDNPNVSGTVFVPPGDFRLFTCHLWDKHNGITITGVGFASKLKALYLPEDHPRNNTPGVGDNYRIFANNPSFADGLHPDDYEIAPMNNVTIQNLQLEGQKDEYFDYYGEEDVFSGHGIFSDPDGTRVKNWVFQNLWTHNFDTSGVSVDQADVMIDGLRSWNNNSHGLGIDAPGFHVTASNIIAWNNGGYGIDIGASRPVISNFHVYENDFGIKASVAEEFGGAVGIITNGKVENSYRKGFQLTGVADRIFLDNIEFRENGQVGLDAQQGGELFLGQLSSIDDNLDDEGTRRGGIRLNTPDQGEPMKVVADKLHVKGANGSGVYLEEGTELRVDQLESIGNSEVGIKQKGGILTVHDGKISGHEQTSVQVSAGERTVLKTLDLADDVGVDLGAEASNVTLRDIDASDTSTPVQIADGVDPRIEDVAGFPTAATGTASFSDGGGQQVFTIAHGLAVPPEYVMAIADGTTDAPPVANVQNITDSSFDIEFEEPAPSGATNVGANWEASAFTGSAGGSGDDGTGGDGGATVDGSFETGSLQSGWEGTRSRYSVVDASNLNFDAVDGSYVLECAADNGTGEIYAPSGLSNSFSKGSVGKMYVRWDAEPDPNSEFRGWFGLSDASNYYEATLSGGKDEFFLRENDGGSYGTRESDTSISVVADQWYEIEVTWDDGSLGGSDNDITLALNEYDTSDGSTTNVTTLPTHNDSTHASANGVGLRGYSNGDALVHMDYYHAE